MENSTTPALDVMQAQAGTRIIGSFVRMNEYGKTRNTSHYATFADFAERIKKELQDYGIEQPTFNGKPCMNELAAYFNCTDELNNRAQSAAWKAWNS